MLPLFLAALFSMPVSISGIVPLALAAVVFLLVWRFAGFGTAANTMLTTLAPRLTNLIRFIDSLGVSFLSPVLQAAAAGKWADVPAAIHQVLNQLDDTTQRRQLLGNLAKTLVRDQLSDPEKRDPLLAEIEAILGVKIPRPPNAA